MRLPPHRSRRTSAFTLIQLLISVAIIVVLTAVATLSFQGINSSGKFNKALEEISGILEQARAYASAQDTYVWVVLYENAPASGPKEVYVAAFASNDGTDPFNWTGSVALPTPGTVGSTTLTQIAHIYHYQGLHLQTTTLPNVPTSPTFPATTPNFQITAQSGLGPVTLSSASTVYWVIQFTPTSAARVAASPVDSVWLGLQPALSQTVFDTKNVASLSVSGVTGVTTVYRE